MYALHKKPHLMVLTQCGSQVPATRDLLTEGHKPNFSRSMSVRFSSDSGRKAARTKLANSPTSSAIICCKPSHANNKLHSEEHKKPPAYGSVSFLHDSSSFYQLHFVDITFPTGKFSHKKNIGRCHMQSCRHSHFVQP